MKKRPLSSVVALLLAFSLIGCSGWDAPPPAQQAEANALPPPLTESEQTSLQYAMNRFVAALKASDTEAFITLFPQRGVWTFESSIGGDEARSVHSTLDLRRDLKDRSGLYESFFEGEGDSIRDFVESTHGRPWEYAEDTRFSPPDLPDMRELMYIRWRLEDGVWVVDAVAAPFA